MTERGISIGTALRCRCPRCGIGPLYDGVLTVRGTCPECGHDLRGEDSGDGPAAFIIFLAGAVGVGGVLWTEFTFAPPLWLLLVIWGPVILVLSVLLLRSAKSLLIAQQFKHSAGEGRRSE